MFDDITEDDYPIEFNGKLYYEEDCDEMFNLIYAGAGTLMPGGGAYIGEGTYIYPDGSMGDFE